MIRNLIFDFGQVLIRFDPAEMIRPYVSDPDDRELLAQVLFDRLYWDRLDDGTITDEALMAAAKTRLPERLHAAAEQIYGNWYRHLPPIPGMWELAERMRKDYRLHTYLLSNISKGFAAHADLFPVLRGMDGCVFSAVCGRTKPHAGIFAYLCSTYRLDPAECLFIDDNPRNTAGAEAFGIRAYRFDGDVSALERYLESALTCPDT